MRILLVEDDELLGDGVRGGLKQYGYTVDWLKDGETARFALNSNKFDLILLDLGLPKMSGLALLQSIRRDNINTPVLIITARESIEDRVKGLDSGADDYLKKPFDIDEMCARIRALIRRATGRAEPLITYRDIVMDPAGHTVTLKGEPVSLPRREFALLQKLLENIGQVLSREQLAQTLYGWEEEVDSNALEVHVHNLRKKLDASFIRTVRGVGYMLERE